MSDKPEIIHRRAAVERFAGKKKSAIYADIAEGKFPKPIPLTPGGRAVGWLESELLAWQRDRIAARGAAKVVIGATAA